MKTYIKKPKVGDKIKSEDFGIIGKVVEVFKYKNTIQFMHSKSLKAENEKLEKELGEDYKKLYFECVIEISKTDEKSQYKGEKVVVMDWKEYQTCVKI